LIIAKRPRRYASHHYSTLADTWRQQRKHISVLGTALLPLGTLSLSLSIEMTTDLFFPIEYLLSFYSTFENKFKAG